MREVRCANCDQPLQPGPDGLLVGCEHAGKRNRSHQEWRAIRLASLADTGAGAQPPAPHPQPEVASRPAADTEVPSGARAFRRAAEAAGWTVTATYARGWTPGSLRKVDTVVVRLRRDAERAVACWETGPDGKAKADGAWLLRPVFRKLGTTELRAYLIRPDSSTSLVEVLERLDTSKAARAAAKKGQAA